MGKVKNVAESIIQKKGFGIWPKEVVELQVDDDSDYELIQTLNIEYRFQKFLKLNKLDGLVPLTNPVQEFESFSLEFQELLSSTSSIFVKFIILINLGHIKILQNQLDQGIEILSSANLEIDSHNINNYIESLFYKKHYLLSISFHYIKNLTQEQHWLKKSVNFFPRLPSLSNIESCKWLYLIYDRILLSNNPITIELIDQIFQNKNYVLSFINYSLNKGIKFDSKDVTKFVSTRSKLLLSNTQFPNSDETNNLELEEFLNLVNDCPLINPTLTTELIESGINKTYQSHLLLRSLTGNYLKLNKIEESLHSFEVYFEYIENYYHQNNQSYNDIMGILDIFTQILSYKFKSNNDLKITQDEFEKYLKIMNNFKKILEVFYKNNEIYQVDFDYNVLEPNLNLNNEILNQKLSKFWYILSITNLKLYTSSNSIFPETETNLIKSIIFFKNSIYNDFDNNEILYQYVKFLTSIRKIKESYLILKTVLSNFTEKTIFYFKSWHLLTLILSIEENKDESFKIINFLINEIQEFIELQPQVSFEFKETFIQIKITQLSIIESLFGIEQCLDSLPELFNLYNQLFEIESTQQIEQPSEIDSTRSLKKISTLNKKLKSIKSHKDHAPIPHSKPQHSLQNKLLQKIWLITSTIYFKANLIEDSEQSIIEAEKVYGATAETHAILGLITSEIRPIFALEEFEKSLILEPNHSLGIIGLSKLILTPGIKIFTTEKDLNAGLARIKILLELQVKFFENYYISENWWLLSKIYEKFNDLERFKFAIWKSIELEETRPIRDFKNV
ncbi:Cargo-transport protein YPP1 [Wickerhamomyces ciferrii]|uniref:Cargo-transport protein YPP1 n=1 Tax=Wickerhamomyces ciferrii (strain ATCC 14091 / BCRC 22168 / CBS 111 / JCM 3599 / NBRC 0793 / NRRL Y-1031 F-60-10) TaxID=1206466 RepID=K0KPU1_WICCF|nr:Cargo-transport protein YPP1 [Wickerhamomyces ciferrii]CCH45036.1 Cargo-transport protein YPP1 [Wickerhamomyces ciferrii]